MRFVRYTRRIGPEKNNGIGIELCLCVSQKSIRNQLGQPVKARLLSVPGGDGSYERRKAHISRLLSVTNRRGPCARSFRVRYSLFEHHGGTHFLDHHLEIPPFVDRFRALHVAAGYVGVLPLLREGVTTVRHSIRIPRSHAWASMILRELKKSIEV